MSKANFHLTLVDLDEEERQIVSAVSAALGKAGARPRTRSEVVRLIIRRYWQQLNKNEN